MVFMCEKCSRLFEHEKNLKRHSSLCSGNQSESPKQIRCPECKLPQVNMESLKSHIVELHNVMLEVEKYFFKTISEFLDWKTALEKETGEEYKSQNVGLFNGVKRTNLICHRSGYAVKKATMAKRTIGISIKMDSTCPSTMCVIQDANGVNVTFCKTHFGHGSSLPRCLTDDERENIASQIADGVPAKQILDQVNINTSCMDDLKIVTTKEDLLNIRQEYNERITMNHYKAQLMKGQIKIQQISDSIWNIESASKNYLVTQVKAVCDKGNCALKCRFCVICTHMFVCDCPENNLRPNSNMCKHIHACILDKKICFNRYFKNDAAGSSEVENTENKTPSDQKIEQRKKVFVYCATKDGYSKVDVAE